MFVTLVALPFAVLIGAAVGISILLAKLAIETWVAMVIWNWFAPWVLPFTLAQGIGMNAAVSLLVRQGFRTKEERTRREQWEDALTHTVFIPAVVLAAAWVLRWWTVGH